MAIVVIFVSISMSFADDRMMVDLADSDDFEAFHQQDGSIKLWSNSENALFGNKRSAKKNKNSIEVTESKTDSIVPALELQDSGQLLQVREPYKLSHDPMYASIPTLFEAIESLHKQLNASCAKGWRKKKEWHEPEEKYYYVYYSAVCL